MSYRILTELVEGQEAVDEFRVTDQDMEAFATLSGDRNPLHLESRAATERGFQDPIVYGGLLVARVSKMIGMHLPGPGSVWTALQIFFHRPLYVGEPAKLVVRVSSVHPATHTAELKFRITTSDGALVAKGSIGVFLGHVR